MGLIQISVNVTEEMRNFKDIREGLTWTAIIREGIQAIKIKERIMNEPYPAERYEWREEAKKKIEEALKLVK